MGYCSTAQVQAILYSGQTATTTMPADPNRDALLQQIIDALSNEFDLETGRNQSVAGGGFDVQYDVRLYSGQGIQSLDIDEFASVLKVEYNTTIFGTATWSDVTSELSTNRLSLKPIRFWPKRQLFRLNTWIVDPYKQGNTRISGIFGCVQPDLSLSPPTGQTPAWGGLTDGQIQSLAPQPSGPAGIYGWWRTPKDVARAVATWAVYEFKAGQAGFGNQAGRPQSSNITFTGTIPPQVQRVIDKYKGGKLKLALIGLDGSDATEGLFLGEGGQMSTRWAGWQSYNPATGQSN